MSRHSTTVRSPWLLLLALLVVAGCEKKEKKDDKDDDDEGFWAVGDDTAMVRVAGGEVLSTYELPFHDGRALLDIACRGDAQAWAVGERGTVLATHTGGRSWDVLNVGTSVDLRSVAAADRDTVWVVGDAGVFLRTSDDGDTWESLAAPALRWTSVSTNAFGDLVVATAEDGSLWRGEGDDLELVHEATVSLNDVAITSDGRYAAAVGIDGTLLESDDGAYSFSRTSLPTERDLVAVALARDGESLWAAGEAGVFVRRDEMGTHVEELLDSGFFLRDLHLSPNGTGQMVGDAGVMLSTNDSGRHWSAIDGPTTSSLHGVDSIGPHGHP